METTQKKSSKELVKTKSKPRLTLSRKSSNEKNEKPALEHPFIIATHIAIQSNDYSTIKLHLRNPHFDPNITDQQGYSALQIFIKEKIYDGVELLLKDYRVHVKHETLYKKDAHQKAINDYFDKFDEKLSPLRCKIFAHFTLDMVTNKSCESIKSFYINGLITESLLSATIQKIKNNIQQDVTKQTEDQQNNDQNPVIPESACLPDYATDEFIEKKIWFILSSLHI
jgi:hypothetical protein